MLTHGKTREDPPKSNYDIQFTSILPDVPRDGFKPGQTNPIPYKVNWVHRDESQKKTDAYQFITKHIRKGEGATTVRNSKHVYRKTSSTASPPKIKSSTRAIASGSNSRSNSNPLPRIHFWEEFNQERPRLDSRKSPDKTEKKALKHLTAKFWP